MHHPDVYIGGIQHYEGGRPSAIAKRQVDGAVQLTPQGLAGDEQAETRHHGGPDRALCHYPREHYNHWRAQFPVQAEQFCAPAFGENISTLGLTEHNVFIGDIFHWGEALIQVTQPRSPCFKLNFHCDIDDISLLMQQSGRCGWLYRVIASGEVSGDRPLTLAARNSEISVAEAISIAWHMPFDEEQYHRLLAAAGLSATWSKTMLARITTGKIEDFNRRLFGH
ncbi:MOSC domain-containing protein YiiM [Gibbsiella quercinecans]|uniref:6-N-hydroxylaminopurine resistance protein n=1 Tax=Gibbsiella quercinecans TaxID=929813 RepID=A0A250B197_9GAMM|nr:6-hydroxyaminopurine reductase [Gibbsiella quercinecans]ATA19836.1 6-N-hydroxylaminopurine resistance protein [Gibbsiella quercinecans]RLM12625.1 6-N-hydroxylaminopurine resistance protein [Gibbsiella quercinecans]TCT89722.1 MOSC domain-containing protein YiiM [Gibbsiella quercinecans]